MARDFLPYDKDQQFLMPPSLSDWLPANHLAFFVLDVVSQLDLQPFLGRYRRGGAGRAAYDPAMLLGVLLYAYCVGERSSRAIERRLVEDVAFRVIAANQRPDHATIARFRAEHESAISGLFTQALGLCAAAGLGKVGVVAIDGTKVAASASGAANRSAESIAQIVRRMLDEAKVVDEAEDEAFGDRRGDELPAELATREGRAARLAKLKAQLDAEDARRRAEVEAHEQRRIERESTPRPGPKMQQRDPNSVRKATVNTTDPDSAKMKVPGGFVQGYNAQAVVAEDQIIVAAELTNSPTDVGQLAPMLAKMRTELDGAVITASVDTVLADAGYFSESNASIDIDADLLIAPVSGMKLRGGIVAPTPQPDTYTRAIVADELESARRTEIIARWVSGACTAAEAIAALQLSVGRAYGLRDRFRRYGSAGVRSRRRLRPPKPPTARDMMLQKFVAEPTASLYRRRSQIVEPVFGQIKEARRVRRFMRRGLDACSSEWKLIATTHNLLKLWRAGIASDRPPGLAPA